jgi:2-methylcitrate dehydratase PrpD
MSIQYCVAATLANGVIEESNYHLLDDPEIVRLARITKIETDAAFTGAYPGAQGSEVIVNFGERVARSRMDDVIPATPEQIRARFRSACANWRAIEEIIEELEVQEDVGILSGGLAA